MGKLNKRQKAKSTQSKSVPALKEPDDNFLESLNLPSDVFEQKFNNDDTKSVKSMKSIKNELGLKKITKKDKIKLRQKVFLKKVSATTEFKKTIKAQAKTKFHDNLPALGLNLEHIDVKVAEKKKKPIARASKRKNQLVRNVSLYKSIISDKNVLNNAFSSALNVIKQKLEKGAI